MVFEVQRLAASSEYGDDSKRERLHALGEEGGNKYVDQVID